MDGVRTPGFPTRKQSSHQNKSPVRQDFRHNDVMLVLEESTPSFLSCFLFYTTVSWGTGASDIPPGGRRTSHTKRGMCPTRIRSRFYLYIFFFLERIALVLPWHYLVMNLFNLCLDCDLWGSISSWEPLHNVCAGEPILQIVSKCMVCLWALHLIVNEADIMLYLQTFKILRYLYSAIFVFIFWGKKYFISDFK